MGAAFHWWPTIVVFIVPQRAGRHTFANGGENRLSGFLSPAVQEGGALQSPRPNGRHCNATGAKCCEIVVIW